MGCVRSIRAAVIQWQGPRTLRCWPPAMTCVHTRGRDTLWPDNMDRWGRASPARHPQTKSPLQRESGGGERGGWDGRFEEDKAGRSPFFSRAQATPCIVTQFPDSPTHCCTEHTEVALPSSLTLLRFSRSVSSLYLERQMSGLNNTSRQPLISCPSWSRGCWNCGRGRNIKGGNAKLSLPISKQF